MSHNFPASLEWGCVTDAIKLVRGGDMDRDKALELGQHVAWFSGCAFELFKSQDNPEPIPEPDENVDINVSFGDGGDEAICAKLEECTNQAFAAADGGIDWGMIFNLVLPLLKKLLEKYL